MLNNSTWIARVGFCAALLSALAMAAGAQNGGPQITLKATTRDYHNAPVTISVQTKNAAQQRALAGYLMMVPLEGQVGNSIRAQATTSGKTAQITFILDNLQKGETRKYRISHIVFIRKPDNQVDVKQEGDDIAISCDNIVFTRYSTHSAPNKPVFYPIHTPEGDPMTRQWPVEPTANPDESHDHPHHRGLWFTHSSVNGIDFWSEQSQRLGKTINTGYENLQSGWVYGGFTAKTEWRGPDDKLVATDTRDVKVYRLQNGDRIMDFSLNFTPAGAPVTFGDNKDGVFGLRTPDSLAITADRSSKIKGEGHIETASGVKDKDAWGKPNDWVDYWGPIHGMTYGVAIFDAPTNLRHPETWHARDYALFTVNPFGLHDFGRGAKGAGDYTVPAGKTLNFTYRLLFHKGDTTAAAVGDQYGAFTSPPEARITW